jgi:LmbE family N-acetylglucosaminyl deacetylase
VSAENHFRLGYPTARLDTVPMGDLIAKLSSIIQQFAPEELLLPYGGDVHSDHRVAFNVGVACSKWFRYPTITRVMTYETPSETDFCIDTDASGFKPNLFINIEEEMSRKLDLIDIYRSEVGRFPFPRSTEAFSALAQVRGAQSGFKYAEGFMILRERS